MKPKWYGLFSHTGKELETLQNIADLTLCSALTTNMEYKGSLLVVKCRTGKEVNEWLMKHVAPDSIITLNGYMRIIPAEVLEYLHSIGCKVYNIHPAPIQLYPELKGKDPQERLYEGKYPIIGAVIHEVDAGVDTGRLVHWKTEFATYQSKDELYDRLHEMGTEMWLDFFRERMYEDGQSC